MYEFSDKIAKDLNLSEAREREERSRNYDSSSVKLP